MQDVEGGGSNNFLIRRLPINFPFLMPQDKARHHCSSDHLLLFLQLMLFIIVSAFNLIDLYDSGVLLMTYDEQCSHTAMREWSVGGHCLHSSIPNQGPSCNVNVAKNTFLMCRLIRPY